MKIEHLANSELAVMDLLWQSNSLTARQIRESLYPDSEKSQHGTVQRLLQRLEEKGFVKKDSSQFVHQFSAIISRQAYAGQQLESLASSLTEGSFAPLITHLVEENKISKDEMDQIRHILDNHHLNAGEK